MIALDFAWSHPSVAQLQANGVAVVIRYLTGTGDKPISQAELDSYLAAGICVVFCFEATANDAAGGFAAGAAHAQQANEALVALGQTPAVPVYFAVDESITPQDAVPYFQGICSVRPAPLNGCYGEGALTSCLRAAGLTAWSWQSESTGFPGNATTLPTCHLQQRYNASPIATTDLDVICQADVGAVPRPVAPAPDPPPAPPAPPFQIGGDTVKIIAVPFSATTDANGWTAVAVTLPTQKTKTAVVGVVMDCGSPYDDGWHFCSASVDYEPNQPSTCRIVLKGTPKSFFSGRVNVAV